MWKRTRLGVVLCCAVLAPVEGPTQGLIGLPGYFAAREVGGGLSDVGDGLREVASAARDVAAQAGVLQEELDQDIDKYLRDLDRKIAAIDKIGDEWIAEVARLVEETRLQILKDMARVLDDIECRALRVTGFAREQITLLIPVVLQNDSFEVRLPFPVEEPGRFGFGTVERDIATISLEGNPDARAIYDDIKTAFLENLDTADENDSANDLVLAYGRLAMAARRAACFDETPTRRQLLEDFATFTDMQKAWMDTPELAEALR